MSIKIATGIVKTSTMYVKDRHTGRRSGSVNYPKSFYVINVSAFVMQGG